MAYAGGLAFFLYGMNVLSSGLEKASGGLMEKVLAKMSGNIFMSVIFGALVTAAVQSSTATTVIVVGLCNAGLLKLRGAVGIVMGANIGTCSTPLVSSINSSKNAKRAAMLHFYFNLMGTILFLIGIYAIQYTIGWSFWNDEFTTGDIANFHTIFNVLVTIVFIPFAGVLEKLACLTVRDKKGEEEDVFEKEDLLDERFLVTPNVAIAQTMDVVVQMGIYAQKNFNNVTELFDKYDLKKVEKINEREELIDRLEDRVGSYLVKLNDCALNEDEARNVTTLFHMISEYERIGDYTINIMETAEQLYESERRFSDEAMRELKTLNGAISEIISLAIEATKQNAMDIALEVEPLEEVVDRIVEELKSIHIDRSKTGACSIETGVNFLDILTNAERISDHCSNIAVYILSNNEHYNNLKKHEYLDKLHKSGSRDYLEAIENYTKKYDIHATA